MGFQFRKSINFPGFKFNFSKSGVSTTIGSGGLTSINIGTRGIFVNFRIPGTGISYRTKLFKKIRWKRNKIKKSQKIKVQKNIIRYDTKRNYATNSYRINRKSVNDEARIFLVIMVCAIVIVFFMIFLMLNIK